MLTSQVVWHINLLIKWIGAADLTDADLADDEHLLIKWIGDAELTDADDVADDDYLLIQLDYWASAETIGAADLTDADIAIGMAY